MGKIMVTFSTGLALVCGALVGVAETAPARGLEHHPQLGNEISFTTQPEYHEPLHPAPLQACGPDRQLCTDPAGERDWCCPRSTPERCVRCANTNGGCIDCSGGSRTPF